MPARVRISPAWRQELRAALAIAADHLSLYQLTIEPATQFEALHRQGKIILPDEDTAAALYDATGEECARAGLRATRSPTTPGPARKAGTTWPTGATSTTPASALARMDGSRSMASLHATRRHRAPEVWAERVERDGDGLTADEPVAAEERAREALLMGLRLTEGIDRARFAARTGRTVAAIGGQRTSWTSVSPPAIWS